MCLAVTVVASNQKVTTVYPLPLTREALSPESVSQGTLQDGQGLHSRPQTTLLWRCRQSFCNSCLEIPPKLFKYLEHDLHMSSWFLDEI